MTKDGYHRIGIVVEDRVYDRVHTAIPHGIRAAVIRSLLEMAMDLYDKHGTMAYGAILDGNISFVLKDKADEA